MRRVLNGTKVGTDGGVDEPGFAATCGGEAERGRSASPRTSSSSAQPGFRAGLRTASRHGLSPIARRYSAFVGSSLMSVIDIPVCRWRPFMYGVVAAVGQFVQ